MRILTVKTIIDKLACESQVAGGVIMGINYALFEERLMDRVTGRQVNADMEFYKLGGIKDMPKITVSSPPAKRSRKIATTPPSSDESWRGP